jgi:hypothetical protein
VLFLFELVIFDQSSAVFTSAGFFYDVLGVVGKNSSSENTGKRVELLLCAFQQRPVMPAIKCVVLNDGASRAAR